MKLRVLIVAVAALTIIAAAPASAHARHKHRRHCVAQRQEFTLGGFLYNPHPQANGCAPPVYFGGEYVGQDPDPFIRLQLTRDPATGYAYDQMH